MTGSVNARLLATSHVAGNTRKSSAANRGREESSCASLRKHHGERRCELRDDEPARPKIAEGHRADPRERGIERESSEEEAWILEHRHEGNQLGGALIEGWEGFRHYQVEVFVVEHGQVERRPTGAKGCGEYEQDP
jgi:hypothetical protein